MLNALAEGTPIDFAVAYAGIARSSFFLWMKKGERIIRDCTESEREPSEEERLFITFSDSVKKAQAQAIVERLERINAAAAAGSWQADAWGLERTYPAHFGRNTRDDPKKVEEQPKKGIPNGLVINMVKRDSTGEMSKRTLCATNPTNEQPSEPIEDEFDDSSEDAE